MKTLRPALIAFFLAVSCLFLAIKPASCGESQRAVTFYAYIKDLYYAKSLKTVAPYWISSTRVPLLDMQGTLAGEHLARLRSGYVYQPRITSEVQQGRRWIMTGTGIASSEGQQVRAKLDVIMIFEDGKWRIQYYTWSGLRKSTF